MFGCKALCVARGSLQRDDDRLREPSDFQRADHFAHEPNADDPLFPVFALDGCRFALLGYDEVNASIRLGPTASLHPVAPCPIRRLQQFLELEPIDLV